MFPFYVQIRYPNADLFSDNTHYMPMFLTMAMNKKKKLVPFLDKLFRLFFLCLYCVR